nr:DUF262 domain-containing protein [Nannocystis sp. SCPEA4]
MLTGAVRISDVEHGFKWDVADAVTLLDSVHRGYPIGTLLLWQRPGRKQQLRYGTVLVDAPEADDVLWVVDGQQRLTSLLRVFAGAGAPTEAFTAIYDLASDQFKPLRDRLAHHLPLSETLDPARLAAWLDAHPEPTPYREAALECGRRLRQFRIPANIVVTVDGHVVREIYRRSNHAGKRMDEHAVFAALYQTAGPALEDLAGVAAKLAELRFGPLTEAALSNMLLAIRGSDLGKESLPDFEQEPVQESMIALAQSAHAAIRFIQEDVGIPHVSLLPYSSTLVVLTRFFHLHPQPHARSRELLARWFWRGAITGVHQSETPQIQETLQSVGNNEHATVQALLGRLPGRPPLTFGEGASSHARLRITLLAMLALGPRDLRTGEPVGPDSDEISSPDAYLALLSPIVPGVFDRANSLANRMLHPPVEGGLAPVIIDCDDPELLATHALFLEDRHDLREDRIDDFIRSRDERGFMHLDDFLWRRAQWDEPDTPPVEALRIGSD